MEKKPFFFFFLPPFFSGAGPSCSVRTSLMASMYLVGSESTKYLYWKLMEGLRLNSSMSASISEADW